MPVCNTNFVAFLLSLLNCTPLAESIICWVNDEKTIFKIKNRNLLAQYWSYINKPKNSKISKTPSTEWDKIRRQLLDLTKIGVLKDYSKDKNDKDKYYFNHKDITYQTQEIIFPFVQYKIVDIGDMKEPDLVADKLDRIETTLDLVLQNQKILFSLLQFDYMEYKEVMNDLPDLSTYEL